MIDQKIYKKLEKVNLIVSDVDGVLTNGMVTITTSGEMIRHMNVKDGYAIKQALNHGFNICIISGGTNEGVRVRLQHLGIKDVYLGAHQKLIPFNEFITNNNINPEHVLYMGDDIPDVPVLKQVGLATCPQDAVPEVKDICKYVSHKLGGEGCARDVIQQVLKVQGKWDSDFDAQTF